MRCGGTHRRSLSVEALACGIAVRQALHRRVSPAFLFFGLPFATQDVILHGTWTETNANNQIGRKTRKENYPPVRKA